MVFGPCGLTKQEAAQGGLYGVSGQSVVSVLGGVTDVRGGIFKPRHNAVGHFRARGARHVGLLRLIVQDHVHPRDVTVPGNEFHIPPCMEEVTYRTPMALLSLGQHSVAKMAEHDVDASNPTETPRSVGVSRCDRLVPVRVERVVPRCHYPGIVVTAPLATPIIRTSGEVCHDVAVREQRVARIHVGLEIIVSLESVLLRETCDWKLLKKIIVAT